MFPPVPAEINQQYRYGGPLVWLQLLHMAALIADHRQLAPRQIERFEGFVAFIMLQMMTLPAWRALRYPKGQEIPAAGYL